METRSKTKVTTAATDTPSAVATAGEDMLSAQTSRAPSPARSVASSHCSTASARRRRLLAVKLDACRRTAEIERRLVAEELRLRTEAIDDGDEDDSDEFPMPKTSMPQVGAMTDPVPTKVRTAATFVQPNPIDDIQPVLTKLLARQTIKELPNYDGNPEEWSLFYSQYKSTSRTCAYSDDENVARLARCLRGRARDAVSSLLVTATSAAKIIDTLKLRFGRPDYLIETIINKIRSMHAVRHDDMNAVIEYATAVQNVVAAMITMDETGHLTNTSLLREIVSKLPSILKYQWGFYIQDRLDRNPSLTELSEWLMTVATAATHVASIPAPTRPPTTTTINKPSRLPTNHRQTVLTTSKSPICAMCNNDHRIAKCTDFLRLTIDDRWRYVTDKKFCFSCLSQRHQLRDYRQKKKCTLCDRYHHTLLHAEPIRTQNSNASTSKAVTDEGVISHVSANESVLLKVVPVTVEGPRGEEDVLALLDEGSTMSLIDEELAERIGVSGPASNLRMKGVSDMISTVASQRVSFSIGCKISDVIFKLNNVRTVNNLSLPIYTINLVKTMCKYYDFVNIIDYDKLNRRPLLLLGPDNIDLIVTRRLYHGHDSKTYVSLTRLGYVVHGKLPSATPDDASVMHLCACEDLNDAIRRSFSTEEFGTRHYLTSPRSREDIRALAIMERTTRQVNNRWETGLLWKDDEPTLPISYATARKRLDGIVKKMQRFPEFAARYKEKFEENLEKGYISKLSDQDIEAKSGKTWYLPHFAVFNPNKPNKLRLVLDCAARSMGKSLNDFLLSGPDLLTSLTGVLLNFRCRRYAIIGDIQEMFHRVLIREEDRQSQRLLWIDGEYVMNVMTFGAICSPSSAQFVKNLNARRFELTHPEAVKVIVDHHYVDDLIYSVDDLDEAKQIIDGVINIHASGGFNMRNFMSNSKELLRHLPEDKLSPGGIKLLTDSNDKHLERVLGVNWDPASDEFTFTLKFHKISEEIRSGIHRPTKREVLKVIMSVFDPMGFLLYMTVRARILFQDIWRTKIGWDDSIELSHFEKWRTWLHELKQTRDIRIPCWIMSDTCEKRGPIELHVFCDASSRAFACVAYLRRRTADGWLVTFLMSRARVAPLKTMSIPRLELQAAVIGARLSEILIKYNDVTFDKTFFWSDSKTVLSWLKSDTGRFKPFVAHRVSEVSELTDVRDWRWVPSGMNAADDATRDSPIEDDRIWLTGPDFLRLPEELWPRTDNDIELNEDDVEVKVVCLITTCADVLLDFNRFSQYWRLIRCVAWILRFVNNARRSDKRSRGKLTATDMQDAQRLYVRQSQRRYFANDITLLRHDHCFGRQQHSTTDSVPRRKRP